ncbi:uncharacterized protein SPPG_08403 [Spizellomyces punctatus DAOM BR117]|uniref:Uncharacterized protein n=1 Tax=Spizellomyces punctatus (strain DAOM BR117) TaxID=645134 RepID=A0A0L0H5R8_SPIPD|nr:uncharacterized protein SPPG_08403 [Spizellomyces punctatus DAOM BR117]KNC96251.1 hypothetical protein SPPG_08403 [Spizellomyces punctatus DAOM BR117]|eukprot:XP_016604291.1 hypothetical protein SPPG_08403 [Spizellomyces punctatus DAOM BR117]
MSILTLPSPPKSWDKNKDYVIHNSISEFYSAPIEPVGKAFIAVARRHRHKRTLSEDERIEQALEDAKDEDISLDDDEPETPKLLKSDPLKWKEQDHYAVLGLSKLRWKASEEEIKRAYRRKVLKHHPDKNPDGSDSFFKCVQKAWEVMSEPVKRRQWDSVDPKFDDSVPSAKAKGDFFKLYQPAFEKEARFSKIQPVPELGSGDLTRDEVEAFYNFWFNFDSWRTFENLDEEDTDNVESREEKRWLERRNKAERTKRKKADNARVNKLVEQAFQADPRIKKFREDDKAAKESKKREKEAAARAAEEEAKRKAEEEQAAKEKAEAEERTRQQAEKKEREAAKNALRKEKKTIKRIMRDNNNFLPEDASPDAVATQLQKLDEIMEFLDVSGLEQFRKKLEEAAPGGADDLVLVLDEEHMAMVEAKDAQKQAADASREEAKAKEEKKVVKAPWSAKELATLIKAVKLFPGGTIDRWEKIAEYINEHGGEEGESAETKASRQRTAKEAISQSKVVQSAQAADRQRLQQAAKKPVAKVEINDKPTERVEPATAAAPDEASTAKAVVNGDKAAPKAPQPSMPAPPNASWSTEQQIALEQAMRKFPAASFRENPNERWEKITSEVAGKTKKEIKQRVKELAEMVKKKKQQS